MNKSKLFLVVFCILLAGTFAQPSFAKNEKKPVKSDTFRPVVSRAIRHDTTPQALRDMRPIPFPEKETDYENRNRPFPKALNSVASPAKDAALQSPPNSKIITTPSPFRTFEGSPNNCNCYPPDTNGDVGPNHYVQTVNSQYQVWDKSGNSLLGPININTIWSGFGGDCQTHNNGDPIVLYDHLADRWLISQFAINFGAGQQGHQCIAVSTSDDPTGTWHRYDFQIGNNIINDYPHFGVWPDGYYMSVNQFDVVAPNPFKGAGSVAFERDQMLQGNAAQMVYFNSFLVNQCFDGMLPIDLDCPALPA